MQTIIVEVKNKAAYKELHNLETKNIIRIVKEDFSSYALQGKPMNLGNFRNWVDNAENTPTVSLTEAKQKWKSQKEKLQKNIQ